MKEKSIFYGRCEDSLKSTGWGEGKMSVVRRV